MSDNVKISKWLLRGVKVWGTLAAAWGVICVILVYCSFKSNAGTINDSALALAGTILAALVVGWSWFFQIAQKEKHHLNEQETALKIAKMKSGKD